VRTLTLNARNCGEKPPITVEKPVEKGKEHVNEAGAEPSEPNNAVEKSSQ
jgi:hypothetical protein